jgi:hypothetical protein
VACLLPEDRVPTSPTTRYRDYILTDYAPLCDPTGRLHGVSAFRHALRAAGLLDAAWPLCEALRAHLGPDMTVWGIKYTDAGASFELYFYNNQNNPAGHAMQVTTLATVLSPFVQTGSLADERWPYFMCSLELDAQALATGRATPFRIYLGSGDKARRASGFSYALLGRDTVLENHYWFYDPRRTPELDDVRRRLACSPRSGDPGLRERLLPANLLDCHTVCYAVKGRSDGLYFARLSSRQLREFLARERPGAFETLLAEHETELAHLRWDLGIDFSFAAGEPFRLSKVGIYGVF